MRTPPTRAGRSSATSWRHQQHGRSGTRRRHRALRRRSPADDGRRHHRDQPRGTADRLAPASRVDRQRSRRPAAASTTRRRRQTVAGPGREPGSLYRGGKLDGVRDWTDGRAAKGDLNPLEVDFLTASVAAEQAERAVARRQTLRLKRMVAALTVLALSTAGLAGYSFWKRDTANKDRDLAMSRQVAVTANRLRATDPPWRPGCRWLPTRSPRRWRPGRASSTRPGRRRSRESCGRRRARRT